MKKQLKVDPRRASARMKHLTMDEVRRFFAVIEDKRHRAMFRLLYHRGLRASEIGMIQMSDLNLADDRIEFSRLKGSSGGSYRLCRSERLAVRAWVHERGLEPGPLFRTNRGTGVGRKFLDRLMRRYGKLANLPPDRWHCHALKHSCATHLFDMGESLEDVQDHLGHRNIASTLIYAKFTNQRRTARERRVDAW